MMGVSREIIMQRQLKLWHLILTFALAGVGNALTVGTIYGRLETTVEGNSAALKSSAIERTEILKAIARIDSEGSAKWKSSAPASTQEMQYLSIRVNELKTELEITRAVAMKLSLSVERLAAQMENVQRK